MPSRNIPLIDKAANTVVNLVVHDDDSDWVPGEGLSFGPEGGAIGDTWDGNRYISPPVDIDALRATRITEAWTECGKRCASDIVTVKTSSGELPFGIDDITRANLQQVVIGIEIMPAGTVPNPRPWSPKGRPPVLLTHDDLKAVAIATGYAYDHRMQAYFQHKATLKKIDGDALQSYDLANGWPDPNGVIVVDVSRQPERFSEIAATVQAVVDALHDLGTAPSTP